MNDKRQCGDVVKNMNSRAQLSEFGTWLCHLQLDSLGQVAINHASVSLSINGDNELCE